MLNSQQPEAVQVAAAGALARIEGDQPVSFVLENWKTLTAPVRSQAAEVFFRSDANTVKLVDAIEQGAIQPWMLAPVIETG